MRKLSREEFINHAKNIYSYMNCDRNSMEFLKKDIEQNLNEPSRVMISVFYEVRTYMYGFKQFMEKLK